MDAVTDDAPQMTRRERLVFASGDVFAGGGSALLSVVYFFFLTDVVGLLPGLAGGVVSLSKVWEALAKPVVGQLSDNTRTRWGRRRPYLLVGAGLVLVAELLLWLPTVWLQGQGTKAAFAVATALVYVSVAASVVVPYTSMSTETTTSLSERTRLNLLRLVFSSVSSAVVFVVATLLMQRYKDGELSTWALYGCLGLGFGLAFAIPVLTVGLVARERTPLPTEPTRFSLARLLSGFGVPEFRSLLGLYLCAGLMMDVVATLVMAYTTYVTRISGPVFMAILLLVNLVAVAIISTRLKQVSKNRVYGTLLPLAILAMTGLALWPRAWPAWPAYLIVVLLAVGAAGSQMMTWVMFPDVVDAAELQLRDRRSGALASLMSLVRTLGTAVVVLLVGLVLQAAGYRGKLDAHSSTVQPDSAVWAIRLVLLGAAAGFMSVGWWLARRYPLTHSVCAQNAATLQQRREGAGRD